MGRMFAGSRLRRSGASWPAKYGVSGGRVVVPEPSQRSIDADIDGSDIIEGTDGDKQAAYDEAEATLTDAGEPSFRLMAPVRGRA